jgi:hypothetical protein
MGKMFNIFCLKGNAKKTTFRFYFTPSRKKKTRNVGDDVRKKEPFYVVGGM